MTKVCDKGERGEVRGCVNVVHVRGAESDKFDCETAEEEEEDLGGEKKLGHCEDPQYIIHT